MVTANPTYTRVIPRISATRIVVRMLDVRQTSPVVILMRIVLPLNKYITFSDGFNAEIFGLQFDDGDVLIPR